MGTPKSQWPADLPAHHSSPTTSSNPNKSSWSCQTLSRRRWESFPTSPECKEDLSALVKQLYDQSCSVFGEKFHMEYAVKKRDMEIHNLEMETSESHGSFKIPKL